MTTSGWLKMTKEIFVACLYVFWVIGAFGCGGSNGSSYDPDTIAVAGADQNVLTGTLVTLDGSGSIALWDVEYSWSFVSLPLGSSATLSNATAAKPTFTPDIAGVYVVQLRVKSNSDTDYDTVTITATTLNSAPMANAGPDQNVVTGSLVTLNGSASSDANSDPLSYKWSLVSRPAGSAAALSDTTVVGPTFTADVDGLYVISLVVNDGTASSTSDSVTITAATVNSAPVANAGPDQSVKTLSTVTLNGSASSDADGDTLTYSWALIALPPGSSTILLNDRTASPTFTPDMSGEYVIRLVVDDGTISSAVDNVVVTVTSTFEFGAYYIQYRTYESATPVYRSFLPMTKDGFAIDPATDIAGVSIFDSSTNALTALGVGVSLETYMYLNCMVQPCVQSGPISENGFWGNFDFLPADTYKFVVDTLDGQTLNLDVPYPGQLVLPVVSSSTMQSSLVGSDLVLSWTNPGGPDWAEVDQLRIRLFDINGVPILYVRLDPTVETVTINGSLLDQSAALSNDMLTTWEVLTSWEIQTRAYDGNNMNFARGISSRVNFVAP
jgi:hypothetical protein